MFINNSELFMLDFTSNCQIKLFILANDLYVIGKIYILSTLYGIHCMAYNIE